MAIVSSSDYLPVEPVAFPCRMSPQRRILTVLFVMSFALDFKGTAGGSLLQFLMAGVNSATFILLALSYRLALPTRGLPSFVLLGWGGLLAVGTMGALVNAVPFGHYIRIAYTFLLFLEGFLVSWWVAREPRNVKLIMSAMTSAAIVSLFFTFAWGFYFTAEGVSQIRYQILSPLIPFLVVVSGFDLFFARRRRLLSLFLLAVILTALVLSVTRGVLLDIAFVAFVILLAAFWNASRTAHLPRLILRSASGATVFLAIAAVAVVLFNPEVLGRWVHRGLGPAHDVTFWTRMAAVDGQYQALMTHSLGWLLGRGFGGSYPWPVSNFPWILPYLSPQAVGRSVWFPGEFMWMPFIFYGGLIVGLFAAINLLAIALRGFRVLSNLLVGRSWKNARLRPIWLAVLGYFAFIGMGFTANPFILRLGAMFMGLCAGIVLAEVRYRKTIGKKN